MLLVDDVHWMDAQSRTLLASLATRLAAAPVLLVTAARHTDRFVDDTPSAQRLSLSPLSVDDVGELVMSIAQLPPEPWADAFVGALHATSSGSPLLVLETLQLVIERGQLQLAEQKWSTPDSDALIAALGAGRAMQQRLAALPGGARDALLRLAVAGIAVDDAALPHLLSQDGRESLTLLETRGLVTRSDNSWRVAHDEIATLSIEMAGDADRVRANEAMASHLERSSNGDVSLLLRAAWHRARTSDTSALDRTFARAVRSARLSGDFAAIRNLGREVLGATAATADVERLVSRLPWGVRYRQWRLTAGVVTAGIVALMAIALFSRGVAQARASDVSVVLLTTDGGAPEFVSVPVVITDLARNQPIDVESVRAPFPARVLDSVSVTGSLGDGYFGSAMLTGGVNDGIELVHVSASGKFGPLLQRSHDQGTASISPDRQRIAFTSGEWHPSQRADVALMDVRTGEVRRLTDTDAREGAPKWSPEGSRVAFVRSFATRAPAQVCWKTIDTLIERCRELGADYIPALVLAWALRSDRAGDRDQPTGAQLIAPGTRHGVG